MRGLAALANILTLLSSSLALHVTEKRAGAFVGVDATTRTFTLNGAHYGFTGTNAYWLPQLDNNADIDKALSDMQAQGIKVVRTWAFNDVTSSPTYGAAYQIWSNGHATFNTGAHGISRLDYVVSAASARGIKLILPLVNNWQDYGGMDVYVSQIVGSNGKHDDFYTNANVQAAYKTYVKNVVSRYKDNTAVMAWELTNEARCKGSGLATSGQCTTSTITNWASTMSAYIKSIDPNHLVALGDEGFMGIAGSSDYPYSNYEGISFTDLLKVSTLDFGTFHLYPESWGVSADHTQWGVNWIQAHHDAGWNAGKPVVCEEFGVTSNQYDTYKAWYAKFQSTWIGGNNIWQFGDTLSIGNVPSGNDGYVIYPNSPVVALIKQDASMH